MVYEFPLPFVFTDIGNCENHERYPYGGKAEELDACKGLMVQEKAQEEGQAGGNVLAESQYIQWQVVVSGGKEQERQGRHRTGTEKVSK